MKKNNTTYDYRYISALMKCSSVFLLLILSGRLFATSLFDVHLHYKQDDADSLGAAAIVSILKTNQVRYAVVTSTPPELVTSLYQQSPQIIVPMLGAYQTSEDKTRWFDDIHLPKRLESELKKGGWRAIGELHIFAEHRYKAVFKQIVQLAVDYKLPLSIHGDPAVIDTIYQLAPGQAVVWAHAGRFPYPDLLADYLRRYPQLYVDLSVRDERIAPGGELDDDWYQLFVQYPGRFMVGVDTFSTARWKKFDKAVYKIRHWLSQLPAEISQKIAFDNANRVFRQREIE